MDSHNTAQLTQLQVAFVGEDKIETRGVQQLLCTKEKKNTYWARNDEVWLWVEVAAENVVTVPLQRL